MMCKKMATRRCLVMLVLLVVSALMPGCELPPPETQQQAGDQTITQPPDQGEGTLGALIHRIDMPMDVSLDDCWAQVDEQAVPVLMSGMWQVNGMRIGLLHAEDAVAFAEALPTIYGESRAKLYTSHYPTAVRSTPRLRKSVSVDLTVPPRSPTLYRARGGNLQMLVRIGRSDNGQVFVETTPHHYKQKSDLIPRSPLEKQLDGRVFNELAALLPVDPETAIVIGLYRPWPEPEVTTTEGTETTEEGKTKEQTNSNNESTPTDKPIPTDDSSDTVPDETTNQQSEISNQKSPPPPIPEGLGRSLMTGTRAGQQIQIMLVISMLEEEPADTPAGTE